MAKKSDYFGLDRIVSLVLAIIPFTAWILGILTRAKEEKWIAVIVRCFFGWIIWLIDLYMMITKGSIWRYL